MRLFQLTAVLGALAVTLGAMGAHGHVADVLSQTGRAANWTTASHYHLVHSVVLLLVAWLSRTSAPMRLTWALLATGVVIFSGSLYILAYTGIKWLGAITPIGGLLMILGWLSLARYKDSNA
jgi:uncharacterized membrane protein YgdD (TMEM256/DUF423 family)